MLVQVLRRYHRTGLRGRNRITKILAERIPALQSVFLPTVNGDICVDLRIPIAHSFFSRPPDTGEEAVMKKVVREGDTVYDIGANFGYYSLLLSNLVASNGKVYAFEPNPEILKNLQLTIKSKPNIKLFPVALSDRKGDAVLFVPEDVSMASLGNWTEEGRYGGEIHEASCKMQKLDELIREENLPLPQFIKCDVEGAELSVLRGGISVFNRVDAPIFMFEANAAAAQGFGNDSTVLKFLGELKLPDYQCFEILENGDLKEVKSNDFLWSNLIAVPASKLSMIDRQS